MESDEYKATCVVQGTAVSCEPVVDGGLDSGKLQNCEDEGNAIGGVARSPAPEGQAGTLGIAMPPEVISLTALDIEYKFEHIHIPMDVTASYVEAAPQTGQVSVVTAKRLLRYIAGLTSMAQRRSLEAREQLIRMKRKQDMLVAEVEDEMRRSKKALATCMQAAEGITSDEATGNVEVHGGSRSKVGYQEHCVAPPTTTLHQENKKNEGCALLQTDVQIGHDDNVHHTCFTSDSDGPTQTDDYLTEEGTYIEHYSELKADAQSHVHGDGGSDDKIHGRPN